MAIGAPRGVFLSCSAFKVAASVITRAAAKVVQMKGAIAIARAQRDGRPAIGRLSCVSPTPGQVECCCDKGMLQLMLVKGYSWGSLRARVCSEWRLNRGCLGSGAVSAILIGRV